MKNVFVSHITEEAPIALELKKFIETSFLGTISVFASTDVHDLTPGSRWLDRIEKALKESTLLLIICSPSSLTRPWINFEAGCGWIKGAEIIPICHSGQRKDQLPYPFSQFMALSLFDEAFGETLVQSLCTYFKIGKPPCDFKKLSKRLERARSSISGGDATPQIIHSPKERTKLVNDDLRTLLHSTRVAEETVWTSAFLSTFAIGPDDPYRDEGQEYLKLLLEERDLLLQLGRKGCTIKCIISPANKNHIRHAGIDYAIKRTQTLIDLLGSNEKALSRIDWAISELGTKNLYIIGHLSCFEGYKKGIQQGYGLTLRQTSPDVVKANIEVYTGFFKDLAARALANWADRNDAATSERELLRMAARRCLESSLDFLYSFSAALPIGGSSKPDLRSA